MPGHPGPNSTHTGTEALERPYDDGFGSGSTDGWTDPRLGDPLAQRPGDQLAGMPGFDPVWGTLGAPTGQGRGGWPAGDEGQAGGVVVDVELLGDGIHLAGQIRVGQFDRLSSWLNMQSGFIQLRNARHIRPGTGSTHADQQGSTLWVRLSQIVLVADQSAVQPVRSGVAIVEKQRRNVSIFTRGFELKGNIHVHAHAQMAQFLEAPDPRFMPITELTVRGLAGSEHLAFSSAMVNREQLVTLLEAAEVTEDGMDRQEARSACRRHGPTSRRLVGIGVQTRVVTLGSGRLTNASSISEPDKAATCFQETS